MYPAAVIFDFDGVIVDTEPLHYQAFQRVLEPFELGYSWQEYQATYMGFDDRDAFREVFRNNNRELTDKMLQDLINAKADIFESVIEQGVTPYPGVVELIKELSSKNIPIAICSGALKSDITPVLMQFEIKTYFSSITTAEDVSQSKPHPASYIHAKNLLIESYSNLASKSSEIIAIEDTPAGIKSAKSAGLRVIAITNSYPASHLTEADVCISSLNELIGGNWP